MKIRSYLEVPFGVLDLGSLERIGAAVRVLSLFDETETRWPERWFVCQDEICIGPTRLGARLGWSKQRAAELLGLMQKRCMIERIPRAEVAARSPDHKVPKEPIYHGFRSSLLFDLAHPDGEENASKPEEPCQVCGAETAAVQCSECDRRTCRACSLLLGGKDVCTECDFGNRYR